MDTTSVLPDSAANTYLSIFPARQSSTVSRDAPIYEARPTSTGAPPAPPRGSRSASLSNVFDSIRAQGASSKPATAAVNAPLRIRLAVQDILLPFIDREKEVEDLLTNSRSGIELCKQLKSVHDKHVIIDDVSEWQRIHDLLFSTSRSTLNDRQWLQQLRSLILVRNPRLWCGLLEVLGAHEINLDPSSSQDEVRKEAEQSSVADPESLTVDTLVPSPDPASFEVLTSVPSTFAKSPKTVDGVSVRSPDPVIGRDPSCLDVSNCDEVDADRLLKNQANSFAGLRVRLPSLSSATSSAHSSNASRSGSFSSMPDVSFTHHRRLSQLFMTPLAIEEGKSTQMGDEVRRRSATMPRHQRQRSQPEGLTLSRPSMYSSHKRASFSSTWSEIQDRKRDRSRLTESALTSIDDDISPKIMARKRSSTVANVNAGSTSTWPRSIDKSFLQPGLHGLLPDGRTRHPSASSNDSDSKAAIAAFRYSILLSSPTPKSAASDDLASVSNSGSETEGGADTEMKASQTNALPHTDTEDRKQQPVSSSILFPIPPSIHFSRPQELGKRLDEAAKCHSSAWNFLLAAIGTAGVEHVRQTINRSGERATCSDEKLVSRLAANCFGMVEMDLVTSGSAVHYDQSTLKNRLRTRPWYIHGQRGGAHSSDAIATRSAKHNSEALQEHQADVDHQARLWAYYEDVDGYEERYIALDKLMRDVWNVDNDVMSVVRQRCGPARRLTLTSDRGEGHD